MKAGFSRVSITPPVGTTMMGFGDRDMAHGCTAIHDEIHVRALALEHKGERTLIMGFDLCFLGREETDRLKGAIGRYLDLTPRRMLLNTSHNHVGPAVGTWYSAGYAAPDRLYLSRLEEAVIEAACKAFGHMKSVTLSAGMTRTQLPMNRRRRMPNSHIENRPNPHKRAYDRLPICLFTDDGGTPVCLLFSVSCHPSMMTGWEISAEYPGVAMRRLDEHFGLPCSLFLQGVGGDAKPAVIGGHGVDTWQKGTWELMEEAGAIVAEEVIEALQSAMNLVEPSLHAALTEMKWPLQPTPSRSELEKCAENLDAAAKEEVVKRLWARTQLARLDRGFELATSVTLTIHGMTLGNGVRLIGIEGEAVGDWGYFIESYFGGGVTFALGYSNGQGLYLPTSEMVTEGGYEVTSGWEYGFPSNLARGMETPMRKALEELTSLGIV